MSVASFDQQLQEVIKSRRELTKVAQDLAQIEVDLGAQQFRLTDLSAKLAEEKVDVESLEGMSLQAIYHTIRGTREERLESERS